MSSALVIGNFGLYGGRQTLVKAPGSTGPGTPFYLYSLQFQLSANNGSPMDGTVRVYAPASSQPVPDGTVVYIMAKVHIAPDIGGAILEPIYFFPFPGDPDDEAYEAAIPDMEGTTFSGLGTVIQNGPRDFVLRVSEYLRGGVQTSVVGCFFEDTVRWQRTKPPRVGGTVFVVGTCSHVLQQRLHVSVSHLVFGAQVNGLEATDDDGGGPPAQGGQPSRPRKYGPPKTDVASVLMTTNDNNGSKTPHAGKAQNSVGVANVGKGSHAGASSQLGGISSASGGAVASSSTSDPLSAAPFAFAPSDHVVDRDASAPADNGDNAVPSDSAAPTDNSGSPPVSATPGRAAKGKKRARE